MYKTTAIRDKKGKIIHEVRAPCAGQVRLADQHPVHRGAGQPLVPVGDGQLRPQAQQVAAEGARGLAARPLGPVHVHRQADHQADGFSPIHQLE